jgi:hypothetical protein
MTKLMEQWEHGDKSVDIRAYLQRESGCSYAEASRYADFCRDGFLLASGSKRSYHILMPEMLRQRIEEMAVANKRTLSEQVIKMLAQGCINGGKHGN